MSRDGETLHMVAFLMSERAKLWAATAAATVQAAAKIRLTTFGRATGVGATDGAGISATIGRLQEAALVVVRVAKLLVCFRRTDALIVGAGLVGAACSAVCRTSARVGDRAALVGSTQNRRANALVVIALLSAAATSTVYRGTTRVGDRAALIHAAGGRRANTLVVVALLSSAT